MLVKSKYRGLYILFVIFLFTLLTVLVFRFFLPDPLFNAPYSTVLFDRENDLLGARIATDGQWRFTGKKGLPEKYEKALLLFEDKSFYYHPGVNPISVLGAMIDNLKAGKVVRGGSTITMQVIRLSRKGEPRSVIEKVIEIFYALALETKLSKKEILDLYASYAPYGGNVVGLEAAAWRYFGRSAGELSWSEAALLAVLPNAPSLIHPGKNRVLLTEKRNRLLKRLLDEGFMDATSYQLALLEKIPAKPKRLPDLTPHLTEYLRTGQAGTVMTTIDRKLQKKVNDILLSYYRRFRQNEVYNIAVIVIKPGTKEVLAYAGNVPGAGGHGFANDMIRAERSTGSILKPLLYAAALQEGQILPNSLVPDIPSYFKNYHPQNFDLSFEGAVPASEALSRSRNVPAVYLLRDYGIGRFLDKLKQMGFTSFDKPADHYGLTLILGGGEASLWEVSSAYAGMAQTLINYYDFYGKYTGNEFDPPVILLDRVKKIEEPKRSAFVPLKAGAVWTTFQSLYKVKRPQELEGWEYFASSKKIAWKTGTSFGFKDGWAVGTTKEYVVGVWVGNADGEGRPGLTGTRYAAPVMFEIFEQFQMSDDFESPEDELRAVAVCRKSGFRASSVCPEVDTVITYEKGLDAHVCKYHKVIFTDEKGKYRVSSKCMTVNKMKRKVWFVLPPVQEWYYRKSHPSYRTIPPWKPGCSPIEENGVMAFVYPLNGTRVFVPKDEDGNKKEVVFEVSHQDAKAVLYWHLDNTFIGTTKGEHKLPFIPGYGKHTLAVVDNNGASKKVFFEVVN